MAKKKAKSPKSGSKRKQGKPTKIWGDDVELNGWIKMPEALARLWRYHPRANETVEFVMTDGPKKGQKVTKKWRQAIGSSHIVLMLALASRKFQDRPIRAYWEELGEDLGVTKSAVRKSAYRLRDLGLLEWRQHRGRDPETNRVGHRNERNEFDLAPFVAFVREAWRVFQRDIEDRKKNRESDDDE